jgi:predicted nucleic acid-binding protein
MILVDTAVWFSLLVQKDSRHDEVSKWFDGLSEQILTTDYIIDETLTLLLMRKEVLKAIEFGKLIFHADIAMVHFISQNQIYTSWILFQQMCKMGLSFTDCTTHTIATEMAVKRIATFDSHFLSTGKFEVVP